MWLRRLVGIVMIITCVGMNALVLIGFFAPSKNKQLATPAAQVVQIPPPVVSVTAQPDAITAGNFSALTWSATGNPESCIATGNWNGFKTPFGAQSTGRLSIPGQYKYSLSCTNAGGSNVATVTLAVGPASAPPPKSPVSNTAGRATSNASQAVSYCGGRIPCLNARDVSRHSSSGNCWGWLGDRVINVAGFDSGFHAARSGVANIQIGGVCGKDLGPSINGSVPTPEYPSGHAHQLGATSNTDANYLGYFVGYYDNSKP